MPSKAIPRASPWKITPSWTLNRESGVLGRKRKRTPPHIVIWGQQPLLCSVLYGWWTNQIKSRAHTWGEIEAIAWVLSRTFFLSILIAINHIVCSWKLNQFFFCQKNRLSFSSRQSQLQDEFPGYWRPECKFNLVPELFVNFYNLIPAATDLSPPPLFLPFSFNRSVLIWNFFANYVAVPHFLSVKTKLIQSSLKFSAEFSIARWFLFFFILYSHLIDRIGLILLAVGNKIVKHVRCCRVCEELNSGKRARRCLEYF